MRPIARRVGNAREVRSGCRAGSWPSARAASGCGLCLAVLFLPCTDGRSGSPAGAALSISLASPRPTATGAGTSGNEPGSWHPAGRSIAESAAPGEHRGTLRAYVPVRHPHSDAVTARPGREADVQAFRGRPRPRIVGVPRPAWAFSRRHRTSACGRALRERCRSYLRQCTGFPATYLKGTT